MKSKQQKRQEALERSQNYQYENSRACRNNVGYDKWLKNKEKYEARLQETLPKTRKR